MSNRNTSFAHQQERARGEPSSHKSSRADFEAARSAFFKDRASNDRFGEEQGSAMVKRQHPAPALRPGPGLREDSDREVFNAQLKADDDAARKRAFMRARTAADHAGAYTLRRDFTQTRGVHYDRST